MEEQESCNLSIMEDRARLKELLMQEAQMEFERVLVLCYKCGKLHVSTLSTFEFPCIGCGIFLMPRTHLVVEKEGDIN